MKLKMIGVGLSLLAGLAIISPHVYGRNNPEQSLQTLELEGWYHHKQKDFNATLSSAHEPHSAQNTSILVEGFKNDSRKFTTLVKGIDPPEGVSRLRLSADIKSEDLQGWAGLWMRVDGKDKKTLAFDNMHDRSITGNTDWKKYEVILEVDPSAENISLGFLLVGKGKAWVDNLQYEPVNDSVASTNIKNTPAEEPQNLSFN